MYSSYDLDSIFNNLFINSNTTELQEDSKASSNKKVSFEDISPPKKKIILTNISKRKKSYKTQESQVNSSSFSSGSYESLYYIKSDESLKHISNELLKYESVSTELNDEMDIYLSKLSNHGELIKIYIIFKDLKKYKIFVDIKPYEVFLGVYSIIVKI